MIDATIINIIPPLVAAILTYVISNKRARIQHAKLLADMQSQAIEQVSSAEEKMRKEIWDELQKVREKNEELEQEKETLAEKVQHNSELIQILRQEVTSLRAINTSLQEQINKG